MIIGTHDTARAPFLIAEIGNNHEGDPAFALELAEAAVEAGADAVKVQIIEPGRLVNVANTERIAQLERFRLDRDVFLEMARRVRSRGRVFMASAFDCDTLRAFQADLDAVKIASGDLDFDPLLEVAAASGKPVVLSTGMASIDEIARAVGVFESALEPGASVVERLAVLHCVSLYPTQLEQANLGAVPQLTERLGLTIGYSDHTLGIEAAVLSLALGARIIEKHFTLDKQHSSFRDHALSAEPSELAALARIMRSFDSMLHQQEKGEADASMRAVARRSIVARRALAAGAVLQPEDLDYVRPGDGLSPAQVRQVLGRRLKRALERHERIQATDVEQT